jgi:CheY-like chemotaxis protein
LKGDAVMTASVFCVLKRDGEPAVADVLNEAATRFGHRTAIAHNDVQAMRAVREFAPHAVLHDILAGL